MADKKISQFPIKPQLKRTDTFPILNQDNLPATDAQGSIGQVIDIATADAMALAIIFGM